MTKTMAALILATSIAHGAEPEVEFTEEFTEVFVAPEVVTYTEEGLKQFLIALGPHWAFSKIQGHLVPTFCVAKHLPDLCTVLPVDQYKQLFDYISNQVHL